ncbi:MAG: winged helix-turn-helix domain-containing protein [Verrucomicrobiales bacterium]|nr:winged helix-turn-helix domain-containing protein [Verrucomicrobiales bacterium]
MASADHTVRFGVFELDIRSGELRKSGARIRLQEQPLQILSLLLERPGEIVTREAICKKLWPDGTFVDFDHSLNAAVVRLREALDDSADNPRFIETVPRRGYRFIAPVQGRADDSSAPSAARAASRSRRKLWWVAATVVMLLLSLALPIALNVGGLRQRLFASTDSQPKIESIAVLPLKNLMNDPAQDYFVEGMHESLIAELSKVSALKVISRTSAMQFKEAKMSLPEIARKLNVDAVVEGSVLREGNQIRITVQLIYGPSEKQLWGRSFDRELGGILILYREVAKAIADEIKVALTPSEKARLTNARSVRPEAHEAFLKGLSIWGQRADDSAQRSMEYFKQAIALDPNYALAYARLAFSHTLAAVPPREHFPKAKEAALKALEIDDQVAEAYAALALTSYFYDWDWAAAEQYARRALELDPNSAVSHHVYGLYLSTMGRHDEAIAAMQRAAELEPLVPLSIINLAKTYVWAQQYERARQVMLNCVELDPKCASDAHFVFGVIYMQQGLYQQALEEFKKEERIAGCCLFQVYVLYALTGRKREARVALNDFKREKNASGLAIARLHAALGDRDEAFTWLEKAYQQRNRDLPNLKETPEWDPLHPLRDDPRFQDLLRRMNFPE